MEFKIDTKDTFTTITPITERISAKMTGELVETCEKIRQSGSANFIIDLQHCSAIDRNAITELVKMHEESYSADQSLVFTGVNEQIMRELKIDETDLLINIVPQMAEAIDIISMEILERDLLSEE